MPGRDRLTGPDASLLALEDGNTHMHAGSCAVLERPTPACADLLAHVERRLHLIPRYRQAAPAELREVAGIAAATAAAP